MKIILSTICIVIFFASLSTTHSQKRHAYVAVPQGEVLDENNTLGESIGKVKLDETVEIVDSAEHARFFSLSTEDKARSRKFIRIKLKDGTTGFIMESFLSDQMSASSAKPAEIRASSGSESAGAAASGSIDPNEWKKYKIDIQAKGTGQTTGRIGILVIRNDSDVPYVLKWGPFFIVSLGKYQSYLVPEGIYFVIPPNSTTSIPMIGFCTDPTVPPVPEGEEFPPFEKWIHPIPTLPDDWTPKPEKGWISGTTTTTLIPGTTTPLGSTLDPTKYPEEYASVVNDVFKRITIALDTLRKNNQVKTIYSSNPPKEDTILIQQTFWGYTYSVFGGSYEKEDFAKKIYDQIDEKTSVPVSQYPEEKKKALDLEITNIFQTIELVGITAKIFPKKEQGPPGLNSEDEPMLIDKKTCECDTIAFDAKIIIKGVSEEILQFNNQPFRIRESNNTFRIERKTTLSSTKPVASGDTVYIHVENLTQVCKICPTDKLKCKPNAVAPPFISYGELTSMSSSTINNLKEIEVMKEQSFVVPNGNTPIAVKIKIHYQCGSKNCTQVECTEEFHIKIPRTNAACDCPDQKLEFNVQHEKNPAQSMVFEKASVKTFSSKVNKRDKIKIILDKEQLNPACKGCEEKCAPFELKYKIFGQGILTLPAEDKAKSVEYKKAKEIKILDNKGVRDDNGPVEVVFETIHECKATGCRTKNCTNRYKFIFERN
ncbi:MAG: hypothetical protein IPM48_06720 [Saprospiraceae bacterium]|nr:hypothetical protein [Saprospiraceae bacterium]